MRKKYSNKEVIEWYKLHKNGNTIKSISKYFKISESVIYSRFKKINLKSIDFRRNTVCHNFFSNDNPKSFYWAGFIAADGCVCMQDGKYKQLRIELSSKDYDHLLKFKEAIDFTGNVYLTKRKSCIIVINSENIFDDLHRFGIVKNKTFTYKIPTKILLSKHVNHFLRGYFDGDGCLSRTLSKNEYVSQMSFNMVGTKNFINQFSHILEKECKLKAKCPRSIKNIFTVSFGGNNIVKKIMDYLYKNSNNNIRLDRKYKIYLSSTNIDKDYIHKSRFSPIIGTNIVTGDIVKFDAIKFAEKAGFARQTISLCLRGIKESYKGYKWNYI